MHPFSLVHPFYFIAIVLLSAGMGSKLVDLYSFDITDSKEILGAGGGHGSIIHSSATSCSTVLGFSIGLDHSSTSIF